MSFLFRILSIDHGTRAHYAELDWPNLLHMSIYSNGQDTLRLIVSADGDRALLFERFCGDDVANRAIIPVIKTW